MSIESKFNIDEIKNFAFERISSIAKINANELTTNELLETEENSRCFSPDEYWIRDFNEDPNSEEIWNAFENALCEAAELYGIEKEEG